LSDPHAANHLSIIDHVLASAGVFNVPDAGSMELVGSRRGDLNLPVATPVSASTAQDDAELADHSDLRVVEPTP